MSTSASGQMKETNFQRFGNHTPRESVNQTTPMCGALLCTQHWACPSSPSGDVQLCGTLRKDVCFSPNFCAICFLPHPLLQHLESVLCIPESRECDYKYTGHGLPWWLSGKESACQYRRCRFDPCGFDVGKIPWRKKWQLTPVFLPWRSYGQKSLVGYSPWGWKRIENDLAIKTQNKKIQVIDFNLYICKELDGY